MRTILIKAISVSALLARWQRLTPATFRRSLRSVSIFEVRSAGATSGSNSPRPVSRWGMDSRLSPVGLWRAILRLGSRRVAAPATSRSHVWVCPRVTHIEADTTASSPDIGVIAEDMVGEDMAAAKDTGDNVLSFQRRK